MVAMTAVPVPGSEEQKGFTAHIEQCVLQQPVSAESRLEVQKSSSKTDEAQNQSTLEMVGDCEQQVRQEETTKTQDADLRHRGRRQESCVGHGVERQGEGRQEEDS